MNINKKLISRKAMAVALAASMTIPTALQPLSVAAAVPNDNYENTSKNVLWSTSFEETDSATLEFEDSKAEAARGAENVRDTLPTAIKGDVTSSVDLNSVDGTANYNTTETKLQLFDNSSSTKWYTRDHVPTEDNPVWVSFQLKEAKTIRVYGVTSANDSPSRDPKAWKLYGSEDGENWNLLDEQTDQSFSNRYEQKIFEIENDTAYQYYKYEITEIAGTFDTQLADLSLGTGVENEVNYGMLSVINNGPASTWNQNSNRGWTGSKALQVSGAQMAADAFASNVIADNLNVTIDEDTYLSYVIFPAMAETYDYDYTQMHMAIDLKFKDGTYLSDLAALDQNENLLNAQAQGDSRVLTTNQWNRVYSKIGEVAKGKTVEQVLVVFDKDTMGDKELEDFKTYFDDVELYTKQDTTYERLSDYVYILRGTNDTAGFSRGLAAPAVTAPHGFNFWVPCTNVNDNNMYDYQDTELKYFTISHEPSYWVGDRGTWQFMINTSLDENATGFNSSSVGSDFSHDKEVAKAHYYSVEFEKDKGNAKGSKIEITPTDHAAVVRATFDADTENRNLLFDCVRASGGFTFSEDGKSFTAYSDHTSNGSKRMYVYGEFSEVPEKTTVSGRQGIARFKGTEVVLKMASSYISAEQAKKNLELEVGDKSFDEVKEESQTAWDEMLSVVSDVQGATEEELISLYSNLYRLNMYPNNMSENVGTAENPEWAYKSPYRDSDAEPVSGKIYINNGFWDTFRTEWSAYALLTPNAETEYLNGLVQHYKDQTWVPRWIAPGGTNSMVGTSSDVIFADAMAKGITFDYEDGYASALRNGATVSSNLTNGGRKNLQTSIFQGYTAGTSENFSWSMEGYINDFGIAQMAKMLAEKETDAAKKADYESEYAYYINRATNYALLFDNEGDSIDDKWLRGKESNGSWTTENTTNGVYDPVRWASDYTETNGYGMSVTVQQDGQGLANLYGGRDQLAAKIDSILEDNTPYCGYGAENGVGGIHEQLEAREVKMGQYGHNNQPAHHILYMYNYAGQPWKTQKNVRDVLDRLYTGSTFGQGYIGDEDNGEMSGWYILSALGFYPVTVGSDEWAIGSPLFDSATIKRDDGKEIKIVANNNSKENVYIQSMTVDGEEYTKNYIKHEDLINSKEIVFNMGSEPNTEWGSGEDELPTSITKGDEVPNPAKDVTGSAVVADMTEEVTTEPVEVSTVYGNIEDVSELVDDTSNTEAALKDGTTTIVYASDLERNVELVTLTSGATANTAPTGMTIYGAKENGEWTELAKYDNIEFKWTRYTRPFAVNSDETYSFYKVELTGGSSLAEIEFLSTEDIGAELGSLLKKAKSIEENEPDLDSSLKELLQEKIVSAEAVAENPEATTSEQQKAFQELNAIVSRIMNIRSAHERIEAEEFSDKHSDIVNDGSNIGGVKKGTWVKYQDIKFEGHVESFDIYYSAQDSDAGGYVEVYLDEMNNEEKKLCTVQVPKTGGWNKYVLVNTSEINNSIVTAGNHDVYLVFKNNTSDPYVSNVDWFSFNLIDYKAVMEEINGIGEVSLDSEEAIAAARSDYDALSNAQKEQVTNYWKLKDAENALEALKEGIANQAAAEAVIQAIDAIGQVSLDSEESIKGARDAYEGLTDAQRVLVTNLQTLKDAEATLAALKADKAAADAVVKLIDGIGSVTLGSEDAIAMVRGAYEELTDVQKALVANLDVLTAAEARLAELKAEKDTADAAAANRVIGLIDEIEVKMSAEDYIQAVRAAYEILTDAQKALVTNYQKLADAEKDLAELKETNKAAAEQVMSLINQIGEVSLESGGAIGTARSAYEALTEEQKALVTNLEVLSVAEVTLEELTDGDAAGKVEEMIRRIDEVSLEKENEIQAARSAYEALTKEQKALVSNLNVLTDAESSLESLKADKAAAGAVAKQIDGIGTVTLGSEAALAMVRKAYEELTDAQKALVLNLDTLKAAEKKLEELKAEKEGADAEAAARVIGLIDKIEVKASAEDYIHAVRVSYSILTEEQKALVTNYQKLADAEADLEDLKEANRAAADRVIGLIGEIGEVTLESGDAVAAARSAYEALTEEQKALVTNLDVLAVAEVKLEEQKDGDAAAKVAELIGQIGEVDLEKENEVTAARSAYEALSDGQKALVSNLNVLTDAESSLVSLKADKAAADAVKELIAALTLTDKARVEAARQAYDALTDAQKSQVGNLEILLTAEKKLGEQTEKPDDTKPSDTAVQIAQPKVLSVKSSAAKKALGRVKISFAKPAQGQEVEVYRKVGTSVKLIGTSTGSYLFDTAPVSGKTAYYSVKVVSKDTAKYTDSLESEPVSIKLPVDTKKVTVKAVSGKKVTVSWKKVKGAKKYYIYRSVKKNGGYVRIAAVKASKRVYTDTKVKAGKKYYYKVVTKNVSGYSAGKASKAVKVKK